MSGNGYKGRPAPEWTDESRGQWLTPPVRSVMRHMTLVCVLLCGVLIGLSWSGHVDPHGAVPAAVVLGFWANLLSLLLLLSRRRG